MPAIDTEKHGSLTISYGEIGERLSEQFKKDLFQRLQKTNSTDIS
jgi:hypothetical protein